MKYLALVFCLVAAISAQAQETAFIDLLNESDESPFVTVAQGGTFSVIYRYSGLDAPGLNAFTTELDFLPDGIILDSFEPFTLPVGWEDFASSNGLSYGGLNWDGGDISGVYDLAIAHFSVASDALLGLSLISFIPPTLGRMEFLDDQGEPIDFVASSISLNVVPEPGAVFLLTAAGVGLLFFRRRFQA